MPIGFMAAGLRSLVLKWGAAGAAGAPHFLNPIGYFLAGGFEGAAELLALDEAVESVVFLVCFLCFFTFVPGAAGEVVGSAGAAGLVGAGVWAWANERAAARADPNIKAVMRFIF